MNWRLFFIAFLTLAVIHSIQSRASDLNLDCPQLLASGDGGKTYTTKDVDGSRSIEKDYNEIFQARHDQSLLQIADHYLSNHGSDSFWIVVPTWDGARKVKRPFIEGRSVHDTLLDPSTSQHEATELVLRFNKASQELNQAILNNYFNVKIRTTEFNPSFFTRDKRDDGAPMFFIDFQTSPISLAAKLTGIHDSLSYIIKTDNVIVEKDTGKLYLVDPH